MTGKTTCVKSARVGRFKVSLLKKVDDKLLFQHMFALDSAATQAQIDEIIDAFVVEPSVASE